MLKLSGKKLFANNKKIAQSNTFQCILCFELRERNDYNNEKTIYAIPRSNDAI